jgi:hypothetical protein
MTGNPLDGPGALLCDKVKGGGEVSISYTNIKIALGVIIGFLYDNIAPSLIPDEPQPQVTDSPRSPSTCVEPALCLALASSSRLR